MDEELKENKEVAHSRRYRNHVVSIKIWPQKTSNEIELFREDVSANHQTKMVKGEREYASFRLISLCRPSNFNLRQGAYTYTDREEHKREWEM